MGGGAGGKMRDILLLWALVLLDCKPPKTGFLMTQLLYDCGINLG